MTIDILLVSPRLPEDDKRRCGDHAYTDLLLQHPPPGVRYYHYEDLIAEGKMHRIRFWHALGYYLIRWGILPPDLWGEYLTTDFIPDLIHIVAFSSAVKLPNANSIPVLVHAASPSITDLTVKRDWDRRKVDRYYRRKRLFLRTAGVHHYALNPDRARKVLVQTEYGRKLLLKYGYVPPSKVEVLYPAQPVPSQNSSVSARRDRDEVTFLFVGSDFERKNGPLVVEAFCRVQQIFPRSRLILVGRPADDQSYDRVEGIMHYTFVPHEQLLSDIFPQADVFVLPTKAEGSFAFTLFEAMSLGLPIITVNAWAMPEIITDGENGFLIRRDSVDDLFLYMQRLAGDMNLVHKMRRSSKAIFQERFSVKAHNTRLRLVYDEVLE